MKEYPKILQLSDPHLSTIFDGNIEITEKIDGSQFGFGKIDGELVCRSKGAQLYMDAPEKMFAPAIEHIKTIQERIPNNSIFYAEYLQKPKHNVLAYQRIPTNHLVLFATASVNYEFTDVWTVLRDWANELNIDVVPLIHYGPLQKFNEEIFNAWLDKESYLGGSKIEGIVVKNYREYWIADRLIPVMSGKYVSDKFKERHNKTWTAKGNKLDMFLQSFRTEAIWNKGIQHYREKGLAVHAPKDIGGIIKEIQEDIIEENKEEIQNWLWKYFQPQICRIAVAGFPEYYKRKLMQETYLGDNND